MDVYAVGLSLVFADSQPSAPAFELAWTTERHFAAATAERSGPRTVRSLEHRRVVTGRGRIADDPDTQALVDRTTAGWDLPEPRPAPDSDEGVVLDVAIRTAAAHLIADVARVLHERDVLRGALGRDVIVLCHTGADSDPWTTLTLEANPPEVHGDFKDFHDAEGVHDERF